MAPGPTPTQTQEQGQAKNMIGMVNDFAMTILKSIILKDTIRKGLSKIEEVLDVLAMLEEVDEAEWELRGRCSDHYLGAEPWRWEFEYSEEEKWVGNHRLHNRVIRARGGSVWKTEVVLSCLDGVCHVEIDNWCDFQDFRSWFFSEWRGILKKRIVELIREAIKVVLE